MSERFDHIPLGDLFEIVKGSICPFLFPDEEFAHHSLPAFDLTGGPAIEFGKQIESNKTLLSEPVVLLSKLNPRTSRVSLVDPTNAELRHCCSTEFIALKTKENGLSLSFYKYYFQTHRFRALLNSVAVGTTNSHVRVNPSETLKWVVPHPSKVEQAKIVEILSTVDLAIEQTEALITKQQRIKAGLMQDLLTRGIDKHGNLRSESTHLFRDSDLGRIPVEWETKPLSSVVDLQVGYALKSSWFSEDGVRLLRGENVGTGTPDWKDTRWLPPEIAAKYQGYNLVAGDLIIGMDRTFTKQGFKVSLLDEHDTPCLLVQRVGLFVPLHIPRGFMQLLIQSPSYQRALLLEQKGMDIPHLSKAEILTPLVPVPQSPDEMEAIARHVEVMRFSLQNNISSLAKLRCLKTALMQDLLTGNKRVMSLLEPELTN